MSMPTLAKPSLQANISYGSRKAIPYDIKTTEISFPIRVALEGFPILNAQLGFVIISILDLKRQVYN
jgi:hypothetical protein